MIPTSKMMNSLPSSDDDDDVPLQMLKPFKSNNSYDSLRVPSKEPCELCEHVSKNRYNSYIHNVRHIIIPLINQRVVQCGMCLHHFTSQHELNQHMTLKHSISDLVVKEEKVHNGRTKVTAKPKTMLQALLEAPAAPMNQKKRNNKEKITVKQEYSAPIIPFDNVSVVSQENRSLKNRLLFEEDINPDNVGQLLSDLTTNCTVNVDWFPTVFKAEIETPSVHYDELMKPGLFSCKKCWRLFPTRYDAIKHESHHIYIKKSKISLCNLCNHYVIGDIEEIKLHKLTSHLDALNSKFQHKEKKYFGGKPEQNGVTKKNGYVCTTMLRLCKYCFLNFKDICPDNYEYVGEVTHRGCPGVRKEYVCSHCGELYTDVKLVNKITKYKREPSSFVDLRKNKKAMSNVDRLEIIKKRFKMMKRLYFVVLFIYPCIKYMYSSPKAFNTRTICH